MTFAVVAGAGVAPSAMSNPSSDRPPFAPASAGARRLLRAISAAPSVPMTASAMTTPATMRTTGLVVSARSVTGEACVVVSAVSVPLSVMPDSVVVVSPPAVSAVLSSMFFREAASFEV